METPQQMLPDQCGRENTLNMITSTTPPIYQLPSRTSKTSPEALHPLWQEVLLLTKEPFPTEYLIKECETELNEGLLLRLYRWVGFLNEQFPHICSFYSPLVFTLLKRIHSNKLLRHQSRYEFEISLEFLRSLFKEEFHMSTEDEDAPACLIQLSLIVGKYPGMVRCRKKDAFEILKKGIGEFTLREVFCKLFVSYQAPQPLLDWVFHLNENELEALMHILQGNNIRSFDGLPAPVSRKESYFISNQSSGYLLPDGLLLEQITATAKLLKFHRDFTSHLEAVLHASKTFRYDPLKMIRDQDFWTRAFTLITHLYPERPQAFEIQQIIDFLEYKKYQQDQAYHLKGRTPDSLLRQVHEWHGELEFDKIENLKDQYWSGDTKDYKYQHGGKEYLVSEIRSTKELLKESRKLRHCAFTYLENCVQGNLSLWSVKVKKGKNYNHLLSLEVHYGRITQAAGLLNRSLTAEEKVLVKKWARDKNYAF